MRGLLLIFDLVFDLGFSAFISVDQRQKVILGFSVPGKTQNLKPTAETLRSQSQEKWPLISLISADRNSIKTIHKIESLCLSKEMRGLLLIFDIFDLVFDLGFSALISVDQRQKVILGFSVSPCY